MAQVFTDANYRCNPAGWALSALAALALSACGGGGDAFPGSTAQFQLSASVLPANVGLAEVQPSFHLSPVLPAEPPLASDATAEPSTQSVAPSMRAMATRRLTPDALQAAVQAAATTIQPAATASVVATYTPAQIRAAYGFPALPSSFTGLTATQAAQLGAGQTIYIVDAQHDPNAAAELAAFSSRFALPACTTRVIATTAARPLAAPSALSCDFSVVYSTPTGGMTSAVPAYNAGWATEIALDVQWAHATAPLARIILIEAADASMNSLLGAIQLANSMGPGIVSMSFGGAEGSWTASVDSSFAGAGMTYLAATGDNGAGVSWPSVSPKVVAVGGTTLTYTGTGSRSEVSWSGTGGGTSAYTAIPSYQTAAVPGMGSLARRTVADVSFNADPSSGQYVATQAPGSSAVSWMSVGGTSLSTPQWAGLMAVANALRLQSGKAVLGAPHSVLYGQIATSATSYSSVFADVTRGSDGTCTTCTARQGYDPLSGLGTPNVSNLLSALSGSTTTTPTPTPTPVTAPVVTAATVNGQVGTALSYTATATTSNSNPLTYTLSGAPAGMAIGSTGVLSWAAPVLGTYNVTVTATDTVTHLSGSAVVVVKIVAATPSGITITASSFSGTAGVALSGTIVVTDPGASAVSISLTGIQPGMVFSGTGLTLNMSWPKPVKGTYNLLVQVRDGAGKSASLTVPVTIK